MKKIFYANENQKRARRTRLKSDKIARQKLDKETKIMVKGPIQQENITTVKIYAPNTGASRYLKQILLELKREIDSNAIKAGDFNTTLSTGLIIQTKSQQRYTKFNLHYRLNGPNGY